MVENLNSRKLLNNVDRVINAATVTNQQFVNRNFAVERKQIGFPQFVGVDDRNDDVNRPVGLRFKAVDKRNVGIVGAKDGFGPCMTLSCARYFGAGSLHA